LLALLVLARLLTAGSYVRVATDAALEAARMFTPLLDFLIFGFLIVMSLIVVGEWYSVRHASASRIPPLAPAVLCSAAWMKQL
jgi:hypothetical protein